MKRGTDNLAKFLFLQKDLKLPKFATVGLLQTLWDFTGVNTPEGNIGKFTNEEIAMAIGYEDDPDALVECLIRRAWLDTSEVHRLVIHHWPDHCEDRIHERLAKERRLFADGSKPRLTSLPTASRPEIERHFKRMIAERDGTAVPEEAAQAAAPEPEPVEPSHSGPESGEMPTACPASPVSGRKRPLTPAPRRAHPETPENARTEPSRTEPSRADTEPSRNLAEPIPSRARAPAPPGAPESVGRSGGSAVSSISDLSASALQKAKPRDKAEAQALFERLLRVSGDPPGYRAWWRTVGAMMRDNGGMDVLNEALDYAENCRDPAVREVKGLGELRKPAAYIGSKCAAHLAPFGLKLPPPPKEARSA